MTKTEQVRAALPAALPGTQAEIVAAMADVAGRTTIRKVLTELLDAGAVLFDHDGVTYSPPAKTADTKPSGFKQQVYKDLVAGKTVCRDDYAVKNATWSTVLADLANPKYCGKRRTPLSLGRLPGHCARVA